MARKWQLEMWRAIGEVLGRGCIGSPDEGPTQAEPERAATAGEVHAACQGRKPGRAATTRPAATVAHPR